MYIMRGISALTTVTMTIYCLGVVLQEVKMIVTFRLWRCFCFEKAWRLEGVVATSGWVVDEDLADQ